MARPLGDALELGSRTLGILVYAVVVRQGEALVLDRPVDRAAELLQAVAPLACVVCELEPVTADDLDAVDSDQVARNDARSASHRADEGIAHDKVAQHGPRVSRYRRVLRSVDDRRERPVNVEQDGGALRRFT